MIEQRPSSTDTTTHDTVPGRRELSNRLSRAEESAPHGRAPGAVALTGARTESERRTGDSSASLRRAPRSVPLVLPPATLDESLATEAARARRAVARARGEVVPDDGADSLAGDPSRHVDAPAETRIEAEAEAEPSIDAHDDVRRREEEIVAAFAASAADSWATAPVGAIDEFFDDELDDDLVPPATVPAVHHDKPLHALDVRGEDVALDVSVAEVAASVIAHMRAVGEAGVRHLEAIELETARRCELATAQAELDAELIRLQARSEAHDVISAARRRVGDDRSSAGSDQLSAIGETFSRFAESVETTLAAAPESFDTPGMP